MFDSIKRLFGKRRPEFDAEAWEQFNEAKEKALEHVLGPMHDMVGHALIPYAVGGTLDLYYFPNDIRGVGIATMELIEPGGSGPKPNRIGTYELVAFTRHKLDLDDKEGTSPFSEARDRLNHILNCIARYSTEAVLNPGETCEFPPFDDGFAPCVVFDLYAPRGRFFAINGKKHCLLLVMEVHRSEMEYAMEHGSEQLLNKLKAKGYYPYSDLDREPVV